MTRAGFSSLDLKVPVNSFESYTSARPQTRPLPGMTIALSQGNLQDWLPGVAGTEPRLGSGFLGGQLKKGGLHQPPFSLRPFVHSGGRYGTSASRECVIEVVLFRGPCSGGALLFFQTTPLAFSALA